MKLKLILATALSLLIAPPTFAEVGHATILAKHLAKYDRMAKVFQTEINICSLMPDQFTKETFDCINNVNKNIQIESDNVKRIFNGYYKNNHKDDEALLNSDSEVAKLKSNCEKSYPEQMQDHFKTQIAYCKTQIDLNRYYVINDIIFSTN